MALLHFAQAVHHVRAHAGRVVHQPIFQQANGRQGCDTGYRVAAKGARVGAGRPGHQRPPGDDRAQRHTRGNPLGHGNDVRLHVEVFHCEHLARAAEARLHLVRDEQDAVSVAEFAQRLHPALGRHDVAAFPLDGFHEDGGDLIGRHLRAEQFLLDFSHAGHLTFGKRQVKRAAIAVSVVDVCHLWQQGGKPAALDNLGGGEGERAHRAAVERVAKGQDMGTPGRIARQFDGGLHRFGPRVGEEDQSRLGDGNEAVQSLCQFHLLWIVEVRARHVQEQVYLLLNGGDNLGMTVTCAGDGNARGEVQIFVAIYVPHPNATAARHNKRVGARVRGGYVRAVAKYPRFGYRTREGAFHHDEPPLYVDVSLRSRYGWERFGWLRSTALPWAERSAPGFGLQPLQAWRAS